VRFEDSIAGMWKQLLTVHYTFYETPDRWNSSYYGTVTNRESCLLRFNCEDSITAGDIYN